MAKKNNAGIGNNHANLGFEADLWRLQPTRCEATWKPPSASPKYARLKAQRKQGAAPEVPK